MKTLIVITYIIVSIILLAAGAFIHRVWKKSQQKAEVQSQQLKKQMTIPDPKVPLAKAPKTGDLSGIWAAISGLSLAGITLLNAKRREEE